MDVTQKIHVKLKKILKRLQNLKVIQSFNLKINFCQVEDNFKGNLLEIDSVLKKCLKRIGTKRRRAEIRKVITKLVRKKNLKDVGVQSENEENHVLDGCLDKKYESPKQNLNLKPDLNSNADTRQLNAGKLKKKKLGIVNYEQNLQKYQKYACPQCKKYFSSFLEWKHHDEQHFQNTFPRKEDRHQIFTSGEKVEEHKTIPKTNTISNNNINKETNSLKPLQINQKGVNAPPPREVKNRKPSGANSTHAANNKENPETFTCVCGKVFKLLKSLKKHESVKHPAKSVTYSCGTCERSFAERGKLNRHMLSHKSSQLQCSQCPKLFARSDALKRHVDVFHKSTKSWSCSFCQKKFSLKYNRDVHEENLHRHSNEWFQCEHCGGKFKNKLTLKSHLKTHSDKRIACSLCSKTFARKIHYKNHMRNKHFGVSLYQNLLDSVAKEDSTATTTATAVQ